jgi:hypothetical protein
VYLKEMDKVIVARHWSNNKETFQRKEQSKYVAQPNPSLCHTLVSLLKISDIEQDV